MAREETQGQNPGKGQCLRMCRGRDKEKQWGRWDVARCQGRGAHRREGLGGRACGGSCFHCQQGGLGGQGGAGRPRELGEDTAFLSRERVAWSFSVKMRVPARRGKDLDVVTRPPLVCSDWCVGCWAAVTLEARYPHLQEPPLHGRHMMDEETEIQRGQVTLGLWSKRARRTEPEAPASQAVFPASFTRKPPSSCGAEFSTARVVWPCANGSGSGSPSPTQPSGCLCYFLSAFLHHEGRGRAPRLHPCPSSPHQLTEAPRSGWRWAQRGSKGNQRRRTELGLAGERWRTAVGASGW